MASHLFLFSSPLARLTDAYSLYVSDYYGVWEPDLFPPTAYPTVLLVNTPVVLFVMVRFRGMTRYLVCRGAAESQPGFGMPLLPPSCILFQGHDPVQSP